MIGQELNLNGESLISVFLPRTTPEESESLYKTVGQQILDEFNPILAAWMEQQTIIKRMHECKTLEQLEAMKYDLLPKDFYQQLSDKLNLVAEISDSERLFFMFKLTDRLLFSTRQWVDLVGQQRAQAIVSQKQSKLILP